MNFISLSISVFFLILTIPFMYFLQTVNILAPNSVPFHLHSTTLHVNGKQNEKIK